MGQNQQEEELLGLLRCAPAEGIQLAVKMYGGAVKTLCRNVLIGCREEDVEEAASDAFVALWKSIDHYDAEHYSSVKNYLYGIARHAALNKRRSLRKSEKEILLEQEWEPELSELLEEAVEGRQNADLVRQAVLAMPYPEREIFLLRYFYFEPVKSIAKKLGLTPKQVENRLYRCKETLKQDLIRRGIQR